MIKCDFLKFCLDLVLKAPSREARASRWHSLRPLVNQGRNLSRVQEAGKEAQLAEQRTGRLGAELGFVGACPWAGGAVPRTTDAAGNLVLGSCLHAGPTWAEVFTAQLGSQVRCWSRACTLNIHKIYI